MSINSMPVWAGKHRKIFTRKESLRYYYHEVFASLLKQQLLQGPTLEIGSGAGFLSHIAEGLITSDYEKMPGINVVCDAHELPFMNQSFSNVFIVDVLHHLNSPLRFFRDVSRMLKPGGRLIMIEPYTTPLSRIFYKYIHHESCCMSDDFWDNAFPPGKDTMTGNAEIPRACLIKHSEPVTGNVPESGLRLHTFIPFAGLSYLLTGGFQIWQCPLPIVRLLYGIEEKTRILWAPLAATRCLAVLERP